MAARRLLSISSDLGWIAITWLPDRLTSLTVGHRTAAEATGRLREPDDLLSDLDDFIEPIANRLIEFAAGDCADDFTDIPLDLRSRTRFQKAVLNACRRIPIGETKSYGQLAAAAGSPRAARAVGQVMASNRFPLIIPCHRVVSANSIGGFSAPSGLKLKRRLLRAEAAYRAHCNTTE